MNHCETVCVFGICSIVALTVSGCPAVSHKEDERNWHDLRGEKLLRPELDFETSLWYLKDLPRTFSWRGPRDSGFEWDHYVTWIAYGAGGQPDSRSAEYIFDGECLGTGAGGFNELLNRLRSLQTGSKVLLFPDYFQDVPGLPTQNKLEFPFQFRVLAKVVSEAGLFLIASSNLDMIRGNRGIWPKPTSRRERDE